MKNSQFILGVICLNLSLSLNAGQWTQSEFETLAKWAETNLSELFSPPTQTIQIDDPQLNVPVWLFRHYPEKEKAFGIYLLRDVYVADIKPIPNTNPVQFDIQPTLIPNATLREFGVLGGNSLYNSSINNISLDRDPYIHENPCDPGIHPPWQ